MLEVQRIRDTVVVSPITKTIFIPVIPGIVTGAAYAAGDAVGTKFRLPDVFRVPGLGATLHSAVLLDRDDEGIATEIVLFNADFVPSADNAAFSLSDADMENCVGVVSFASTDFFNYGANQIALKTGLGLVISSGPTTSLWAQAMTRGAPNIAAANEYGLKLVFLQD